MARLLVQLISLALGHGCVDGCATMINPLIRARVETFGMSVESIAWMATIVMTITCSFSQPLMALWSDRWGARWFALMAPFTAAAGMAAAIDTTSPVWMAVWLGACGVSVAVYHPIPAAMVGDIWPNRRTLALAIFLGGGMIGLGIGPIAVSYILEHLDSDGGWWFLIVAAPITIALLASCGPARHLGGESRSLGSLVQALRGRRGEMAILVAIASIRALATMGLSLGITLLTDRQHTSLTWTGWLLSAFLFSGGVTGLASGLFFHPRRERGVLVVTSLLACVAVALMPMGGPTLMLVCSIIAGSALQGVNPIIVAMSQRILPSGSRMASSLVMGWSWGVGGLLGLVVTMIDPIEWAFVGVGLTLLPAAALTLKLPVVPTSSGVASDA
ncbi:MAG: MFS transporter [Phycisphaerae bacterium]|nr:MFS transporter [Phycisphaerae bacterium]